MSFMIGGLKRFASKWAISRKRPNHRRRAFAYVYFLTTMMLVGIMGLSGLTIARIQFRSSQGTSDVTEARLYAQSAIELGMAMIQQDSVWRTNLGGGAWFTNQVIGAGTMSLVVTIVADADAIADNNPVVLIGTGVNGDAQHRMEVTLTALSDLGGMVISPASWQRTGI